jgi:hypothetical protein
VFRCCGCPRLRPILHCTASSHREHEIEVLSFLTCRIICFPQHPLGHQRYNISTLRAAQVWRTRVQYKCLMQRGSFLSSSPCSAQPRTRDDDRSSQIRFVAHWLALLQASPCNFICSLTGEYRSPRTPNLSASTQMPLPCSAPRILPTLGPSGRVNASHMARQGKVA